MHVQMYSISDVLLAPLIRVVVVLCILLFCGNSHAIFTAILEQRIRTADSSSVPLVTDADTDPSSSSSTTAIVTAAVAKDDVEIRKSKFHFVDLAGSERAKRTVSTCTSRCMSRHVTSTALKLCLV
jgi:hypothetical protein